MYTLEFIASQIGGVVVNGAAAALTVANVISSTKEPADKSLFVALRGTKVDGHQFIEQAFKNGALAAVVSDKASLKGKPGIVCSDTRRAFSRLAALFSGYPSERMHLIGITGTNGKTTTNWLVHQLILAVGGRSMRIGTLGTSAQLCVGQRCFENPGELTTPDAKEIQNSLARAYAGGIRSCVMEASSHALHQYRVQDVAFDVGVYTNLTRDHLDYHGDMEQYFAAKSHLFDLVASSAKQIKAAVINLDDPYGQRLQDKVETLGLNDFSYGEHRYARIRIGAFKQSLEGSELTLYFDDQTFSLRTFFLGRHNASNLAAAFATAVALGIPASDAAKALESVPQVPGRLEIVPGADFGVFVDYAHTPDALEKVLLALREITKNNLWVVFGCGGDRDKGKRPQMARVASHLADKIVVTSDNPRTEDPQSIIADILSGGCNPTLVEADRRQAIVYTIALAKPGDVLLIAGKGHEDYQIIGQVKTHLSDTEEAKKAIMIRASKKVDG